ncbi:MAG TPA: hypothetical protein VGK61_07605 [Planctomycetota bacterium]
MGIRIIPSLIVAAALAGCASSNPIPVLTADDALDRVAAMSEVRQWAKFIAERSKDEVRAIVMIEHESAGPGDPWMVRVAENHNTHVATWKWFLVDRAGAILPLED